MNRILLLMMIIAPFLVGCNHDQNTLFRQLPASQTGIHFNNEIKNSDSLILVNFEYVYNGGGVAIGDLNNDGLQDVYFSGNLVSGKLYLNRGNLEFEDITESAGITTGKWISGVSMVDINQDGWMDLYLCAGGLKSENNDRVNLLYINNGDNTFSESAAAYGLNDAGYSQQAAFLDYDKDGDLDMYLLTTELDPYNWKEYRPRRINGEAPNTDKLYRNNGDLTFTNVSESANILIEGYGLGIGICDLNNDQWPDIYVANDFLSNDVIYINQRDGTFKDQAKDFLDHSSRNGMGTDLQDINQDGLTDIMVLDMLPAQNRRQKTMMGFLDYDKYRIGLSRGYQPQFARNTLQLNNGNGTFSEIGQLAGVHQTDWSWSTLLQDFDNDGQTDIFITNGFRLDVTHMDFATYSRQITSSGLGTEKAKKDQMLAKLKELPEIKLHNYIFKNNGDLTFTDQSEKWGFNEPSYSNGTAFADFDNDGDLDLAINNIDSKAHLYENTLNQKTTKKDRYLRIKLNGKKPNIQGIGAKVWLKYQGKKQYRYFSPYRGYISSVENTLHFGLGETSQVDSLEILWPNGQFQRILNVEANQELTINQIDAQDIFEEIETDEEILFEEKADELGISYQHNEKDFVDFKVQPIIPHKLSGLGPGIAVGDVNGDQLDDFYVGGALGYPGKIYIQNQEGRFDEKSEPINSQLMEMGNLLFDADGDGDKDLYIVSGGTQFIAGAKQYQDKLFLNDGKGNFSLSKNALPKINSSGSSVIGTDFDKDGDIDLFVGGRTISGEYPLAPESFLLRNDSKNGECIFTNVTNELLSVEKLGMVTSALWTDFDNDGWQDLIVLGEWMPVTIYKNLKGEKFENQTEKVGLQNSNGWWNSIVAGDFDHDGDMDYLLGNQGLNTRFKASVEEPVCIYAKDYDKNGRIDPVMCYYVDGENYIAHSRDDLIKQINAMRVRFKTYEAYGKSTFDESFLADELSDAYVVKSNTFASSFLRNDGNGAFQLQPLPLHAQITPIYGMQVGDFNQDGFLDALLIGNSFGTHIAFGPYDAGKGLYLEGDGQGNFQVKSNGTNGFKVTGDGKALAQLNLANGEPLVLAASNRGTLKAFTKTNSKFNVYKDLKADDQYVIINYSDGSKRKEELYYGSTYLSQSSRVIVIPEKATDFTIYDSQGNQRNVPLKH